MPVNSSSTPALIVARRVKRRRRAEGGGVEDWRDREAQEALAAQQQDAPQPSMWDRVKGVGASAADMAKRFSQYDRQMTEDILSAPSRIYQNPGAFTHGLRNLMGLNEGEERTQLWPEKMVRSGFALPRDVMTGQVPQFDPRTGHTSMPMIERAQDLAGMAGGQTLLTGAADRAPMAARAATAAADSAAPGAPIAALERAKAQGYTIDAYKGGQPYDWKTMPETDGRGRVIPGTENRVPQELTSINSPDRPYAGFFSDSPDVANRFAAPFEHGAVWPVKLKFENPLVIDAKGQHAAAFQFDSIARERGTTGEMKQFLGAFEKGSPYDGVIIKNTKDEGTVYVPTNPEQIRSRFAEFAPENAGKAGLLLEDSATPGAALSALENAPKFYSGLDRAVEGIPQPTMTGQQWLGTLSNRGVKAEEMQWSGLGDYLAAKANQPVTKAEVAQHLGANKLELGEVTRGDSMSPSKYHDYQLPGGENYREKLLTMPTSPGAEMRAAAKRWQEAEAAERAAGREGIDVTRRGDLTDATDRALAEFQRLRDRQKESIYKSSHWDEPNVLAHRRTNEREVNGKRSLHVEEIQSDWHQAGRKHGYKLNERERARWEALKNKPDKDLTPQDLKDIEAFGGDRTLSSAAVPDAPFKKNWHELVLKDALREAAESGLDRISWTPGEAQAARYDLSKHVDNLFYKPEDGYLKGFKDGKPVVHKMGVSPEELPSLVGKEAAEKLLSTTPAIHKFYERYDSSNQPSMVHTLEGQDLKIGGEGMKGFYDKIIPDALNKMGKKYGVKTQTAEGSPTRFGIIQNEKIVSPEGGFATAKEARDWALANGWQGKRATVREIQTEMPPVHYMDIPPAMRDDILQKGFSLFEGSADVGAPISGLAKQSKEDSDLVAALLAEQESSKKAKKSVVRLPERKEGGSVTETAMEVARRIKRKKGGRVHVGPISGDTGGRADKVPMSVPDGAYVIPADIVSGLGEGNTGAGMKHLSAMFPESKPSLMREMKGKPIPILAADGEFVISPNSITQRWNDLESGHKYLDAWVLHERQSLIDTLSNLDPPAQD